MFLFGLMSLLTIECSSIHLAKRDEINWNGKNWAFGCDFEGRNLKNVQIRGEDCGGRCYATPGCTHFTWTQWNGGTCWLKTGRVTKNDAFTTNDASMVCGSPMFPVDSNKSDNSKWLFSDRFETGEKVRSDCGGKR